MNEAATSYTLDNNSGTGATRTSALDTSEDASTASPTTTKKRSAAADTALFTVVNAPLQEGRWKRQARNILETHTLTNKGTNIDATRTRTLDAAGGTARHEHTTAVLAECEPGMDSSTATTGVTTQGDTARNACTTDNGGANTNDTASFTGVNAPLQEGEKTSHTTRSRLRSRTTTAGTVTAGNEAGNTTKSATARSKGAATGTLDGRDAKATGTNLNADITLTEVGKSCTIRLRTETTTKRAGSKLLAAHARLLEQHRNQAQGCGQHADRIMCSSAATGLHAGPTAQSDNTRRAVNDHGHTTGTGSHHDARPDLRARDKVQDW
jgi:hypothetical protein